MTDRTPTYPGRVQLTPVPGQANIYDMVMADEPVVPGTALSKANLLDETTAAKYIYQINKNGNTLAGKAVGETVYLNVSGEQTEFIIVHQGNPDSSLYDASCNGTWIIPSANTDFDAGTNTAGRMWGYASVTTTNEYAKSQAHEQLETYTLMRALDADIQSVIKEVKIPYVNGAGGAAVASGANGLKTKLFFLSAYELGFAQSDNASLPIDGAKLDYFTAGTGETASARREYGWDYPTRSPSGSDTTTIFAVTSDGSLMTTACNTIGGNWRPAMILPPELIVSDDGYITAETRDVTPNDIFSILAAAGFVSSGGAITDVDGNVIIDSATVAKKIYWESGEASATSSTTLVFAHTPKIIFISNDYFRSDSTAEYTRYGSGVLVPSGYSFSVAQSYYRNKMSAGGSESIMASAVIRTTLNGKEVTWASVDVRAVNGSNISNSAEDWMVCKQGTIYYYALTQD